MKQGTEQVAAQALEHVKQAATAAQPILFLTGAGMSAASGVPTFRDALTGLWAKYNPTELATPEAFAANPKLVWDWYMMRKSMVENAEPNEGHRVLAAVQNHFPAMQLVTQNVDNLHQRAGSRNVIELHGNITRIRCSRCGTPAATFVEQQDEPPRCACGHFLRPDVVWFGESLPEDALQQAERAAASCALVISIGTSGIVYPAAGLPQLARQAGAVHIEVNVEPTALSSQADYFVQDSAASFLQRLS